MGDALELSSMAALLDYIWILTAFNTKWIVEDQVKAKYQLNDWKTIGSRYYPAFMRE